MNKKNILAIIPARGGSKGIKNKNIKLMNGKPLIYWTIKEAKKVSCIDRIYLSTDSEEIADYGKKYDLDIPFLRPKELAEDNSKAIDAFRWNINILKEQFNEEYDIIIILQPTSPLRKDFHIIEALDLFLLKNADAVISVKKIDHPLEWYKKMDDNFLLSDFLAIDDNKNRQEYKNNIYLPNGAIFIFDKNFLMNNNSSYCSNKTYGYVMEKRFSIDIDDEDDFFIAESYLKREEAFEKS